MTIPVAILCGGKGTRAESSINKCFIEVVGKPFILRTMEMLEDQGFTTFVLCRGSDGTLEALHNARGQLGERFLCLYGDTYLPLDYADFMDAWDESGKLIIQAQWDGIDAGVNGFTTSLLGYKNFMIDGYDLPMLLLDGIENGEVHCYEAPVKWHEVGTPEALAETRQWFGEHA